jgi:hypothetical protein
MSTLLQLVQQPADTSAVLSEATQLGRLLEAPAPSAAAAGGSSGADSLSTAEEYIRDLGWRAMDVCLDMLSRLRPMSLRKLLDLAARARERAGSIGEALSAGFSREARRWHLYVWVDWSVNIDAVVGTSLFSSE